MNNVDRETGGLVDATIAKLRRRQRRLNVWRMCVHGFFWGALAGLALAAGAALLRAEWLAAQPWLPLLLVPAGGVIGALVGALAPIDNLHLARLLDRAAGSEDRFASALQLEHHRRQVRARLVVEDALSRIEGVNPQRAIPLRMPATLKWAGAALVATVLVAIFAPGSEPSASAAEPAPEIAAAEWAQLEAQLRRELEQLEKPASADEEELFRKLENLADLLKDEPSKKEALAEIARLRKEIEKREQGAAQQRSLKQAVAAMSRSEALKQFASLLKQGEYKGASQELKSLSEKLEAGEMTPTATDFENVAADLSQLAVEMASADELQAAAEQSADAAESMNREALAEALRRLAEQLDQQTDQLRQGDNLDALRRMLEELQQRMNQMGECEGCENGCAACQGAGAGNRPGQGLVQRPGAGGGRGGLRAGSASMQNWEGGGMGEEDDGRLPSIAETLERQGQSTSFTVVSPKEQAQSALSYEELYAEMVQKAEADLDLDAVPIAYRDYLRRYFRSIKPQEADEGAAADTSEE